MATLLAEARVNNERRGLTGALAAHRNRFFQVIEGEAQVLHSLLARLKEDPRHFDLKVLDRYPIDRRLLSDWSMVNAKITPTYAAELDELMNSESPSATRVARLLRNAISRSADNE